jgi:hypothetical protein
MKHICKYPQEVVCMIKNNKMGEITEVIPEEYRKIRESKDGLYTTGFFDICLKDEIVGLWQKDIKTVWSCCGHSEVSGMIGVAEEDAEHMFRLGYKKVRLPKSFYQYSFYAKSVRRVVIGDLLEKFRRGRIQFRDWFVHSVLKSDYDR